MYFKKALKLIKQPIKIVSSGWTRGENFGAWEGKREGKREWKREPSGHRRLSALAGGFIVKKILFLSKSSLVSLTLAGLMPRDYASEDPTVSWRRLQSRCLSLYSFCSSYLFSLRVVCVLQLQCVATTTTTTITTVFVVGV